MNNESFDDLLRRLTNQEVQEVISYAYMFDDLRNLREHDRYLQKKLETYENMRKEAFNFVKDKTRNNCWIDQYEANDLLNILNKVGGSDE